MYKQDLEQTLLGIDEEAELEIGPRDDRPSVVLVGGGAFMLNDVTNRSVTHDIDVFEADRCLREIIARYPEVNGMAVAYCNQMPFNYEDRLIPLDIGAPFYQVLYAILGGPGGNEALCLPSERHRRSS